MQDALPHVRRDITGTVTGMAWGGVVLSAEECRISPPTGPPCRMAVKSGKISSPPSTGNRVVDESDCFAQSADHNFDLTPLVANLTHNGILRAMA